MGKFEMILGSLLAFAAVSAIVLMIAYHLWLVYDAYCKDVRARAEREAQRMADERYVQMLETTEYRVTHGIRITNESDLDWGETRTAYKEVV